MNLCRLGIDYSSIIEAHLNSMILASLRRKIRAVSDLTNKIYKHKTTHTYPLFVILLIPKVRDIVKVGSDWRNPILKNQPKPQSIEVAVYAE